MNVLIIQDIAAGIKPNIIAKKYGKPIQEINETYLNFQIIKLALVLGFPNEQIAKKLNVSKNYTETVIKKLSKQFKKQNLYNILWNN